MYTRYPKEITQAMQVPISIQNSSSTVNGTIRDLRAIYELPSLMLHCDPVGVALRGSCDKQGSIDTHDQSALALPYDLLTPGSLAAQHGRTRPSHHRDATRGRLTTTNAEPVTAARPFRHESRPDVL